MAPARAAGLLARTHIGDATGAGLILAGALARLGERAWWPGRAGAQ
jgi:hypothetical protein